MTLGQKIIRIRDKKGMMQYELAKKCNTTPATISRYENDLRIPNVMHAKRIATALGITLDDLVSPEFEIMEQENKIAFVKGLGELLCKYSRTNVDTMEYKFDAGTSKEFVNIKLVDSDKIYKVNITFDDTISILLDVSRFFK